jgi:hypothetical protein
VACIFGLRPIILAPVYCLSYGSCLPCGFCLSFLNAPARFFQSNLIFIYFLNPVGLPAWALLTYFTFWRSGQSRGFPANGAAGGDPAVMSAGAGEPASSPCKNLKFQKSEMAGAWTPSLVPGFADWASRIRRLLFCRPSNGRGGSVHFWRADSNHR